MDKNKAFFLGCLADFLNERATEPQNDIDWKTVFDYATKHQMVNIIEHQCSSFMSENAAKNFKKAGKTALFYRMRIENTIEILAKTCKALDIEYTFLKGPVVAPLYSVPEYRTMGDVDLAVKTEDRQKVLEALLAKGFENKSKNDGYEWVFRYHGIEVELHDKLIYKEVFNDEKQDEFLNNMWGYVKDGEMDKSFHFIYLLHHLKKHLTNQGAGFRQFMDVACVLKNCKELDIKWISEKLKELGMLDFADMCFALCNRWFDTEFVASGIDDDFFEEATETIFENGVFGFFNEDNRFNASINRENAGKSRFSTMIRQIFPSYRNMAAMEQYAFLRKRPYLLPIGWVYRLFWGLKSGQRKRFGGKMDSIFVPKDKVDKRKEELKKWKLDK